MGFPAGSFELDLIAGGGSSLGFGLGWVLLGVLVCFLEFDLVFWLSGEERCPGFARFVFLLCFYGVGGLSASWFVVQPAALVTRGMVFLRIGDA